MKFALAFVLLIGISCQIGRGDCAPDGYGLYDSFTSMMNGAYSTTQNTYHSIKDQLSPLTSYLPSLSSVSDSIYNNLPSMPSVSDSISSGLSNMKESVENVGSKAGDMLNSGMDTAGNLGSEAGSYLKSGADQITDAVNY
ncbi:uncharacterized protein LOC114122560 [Aphis gossypii]|uniref:uncharacterized protein LOC114122560 n=1 Tax=Aphis gossypii TaxID=80765 RepID=UPI00215931EA|nr:uncharacterized protein LOC114122560 [Aphis gossypii]